MNYIPNVMMLNDAFNNTQNISSYVDGYKDDMM